LSQPQVDAGVNKWAQRFKIDHALSRPLRTYSKGMLQRIGFLATILHGPKLIILDEPLSGLDPIGRKELKDVIVEVHREGKTVFFSSHIVPDIEEICDRVVFLKEGKLVYDGSVDQLLRSGQDVDYIVKYRTHNEVTLSTEIKNHQSFPESLFKVRVSEKNKTQLISELVGQGVDITGIDLIKPSLEEIFYHIKAN
jgi:ABC-2 type transport system ATP-binding protein